MSPELLDPPKFGLEESRPTKELDCYALGMVIYEVLSGRTPFYPNKPPTIMQMVLQGKRPERPPEREGELLTDAIWGVLKLCWKPRPSDRTSVEAVLHNLSLAPRGNGHLNQFSGTSFQFYLEHQKHVQLSCGILDPPTPVTRVEGEPLSPPGGDPPGAIPPDGNGLVVPLQEGGSKEGWFKKWFKIIYCRCCCGCCCDI